MTKQEFLNRIGALLSCLPQEQVHEAQAFYTEAIDDRMEEGMSEAEAVASLGDPAHIAEEIIDDLPVVPRAAAKTRRKSSLLFWIIVILGSPAWVPLGAAFFIVVACIYAVVWVLAGCIWLIAAVSCALSPIFWIFSLSGAMAGQLPFACSFLGMGLVALGLGLLIGAAALAASATHARLSAWWLHKATSPFIRRSRVLRPTRS